MEFLNENIDGCMRTEAPRDFTLDPLYNGLSYRQNTYRDHQVDKS